MTWHEFLNHQEKDTVFATELFIQATAVFLGIDICVTSETCIYTQSSLHYVRSL